MSREGIPTAAKRFEAGTVPDPGVDAGGVGRSAEWRFDVLDRQVIGSMWARPRAASDSGVRWPRSRKYVKRPS